MSQPPSSMPNTPVPGNYQRGRSWFTYLAGSVLAFKVHDDDLAGQALMEAESLIGDFAEESNPEAFRDFIAGAMRQAESVIHGETVLDQVIAYLEDPAH